MTILFRRLILRYGVFFLFILMGGGILYFICCFEIRVKSSIHIFYDIHDQMYYGYVSNLNTLPYSSQDTLMVMQTATGDHSFLIYDISKEVSGLKFRMIPIDSFSLYSTYGEGYIYTGKERIKDRMLRNN